jgi:hypothetical protein
VACLAAQLWAGFWINNVLIPWCMAYTFLAPHIDWSGVRYFKKAGRVTRVERPSPARHSAPTDIRLS